MNDLTLTVSGWVATDPKLHIGASGAAMSSFRLASTPRRFDRNAGEWIDGDTEWFTVRVFRAGAMTVQESVAKGQPVVVTGRLRTNTWEANDGSRTDLQVDATAVGHDLTRGVATFRRATGDAALGVAPGAPQPPTAQTAAGDADEPVETAPETGAWDVDPDEPTLPFVETAEPEVVAS